MKHDKVSTFEGHEVSPIVSLETHLSPMDVTTLAQPSSDGVGLSPTGDVSGPLPHLRWSTNHLYGSQTHHLGSSQRADPANKNTAMNLCIQTA